MTRGEKIGAGAAAVAFALFAAMVFALGYALGHEDAPSDMRSKVKVKETVDKDPIDHGGDKELSARLAEIEANTNKALGGKK